MDERTKAIENAVAAIRSSDCGAWLKDCHSMIFDCTDGRAKRLELRPLLDNLYSAVKPIPSEPVEGKSR